MEAEVVQGEGALQVWVKLKKLRVHRKVEAAVAGVWGEGKGGGFKVRRRRVLGEGKGIGWVHAALVAEGGSEARMKVKAARW